MRVFLCRLLGKWFSYKNLRCERNFYPEYGDDIGVPVFLREVILHNEETGSKQKKIKVVCNLSASPMEGLGTEAKVWCHKKA